MLSPLPLHALLDRIVRAPKAELHVHVEGTLEPELAFAIARRNGMSLPYESPDDMRRAFAFTSLESFLRVYYAAASVLHTEQDFFDLAWAYLTRARADNVVHAEIFFDPQAHTLRGVPFATVIGGLGRAVERARGELDMSAGLIMCFLRHLSEAQAFDTLESALPFRDHLLGVGLDSGERGNPPEKFRGVFARCRAVGLHAVAHAGEEGPTASIIGALDDLGAERIDHGVRCLEDEAVVRRLVRDRIPLTVCPLSNVRLRVFRTLADHCLPRLLAAGLRASVHSDDPAFFGGYISRTLTESFSALPLSADDARTLLRNGFSSSFLDDAAKARHLDRLDEVFES